MTEGPNRQHVLDFLNVLYSGDVEAALACCTDDVEFLANAPIDILPHSRATAAARPGCARCEGGPRPLFRAALRGADPGRRGR